MRQLPVLNKTEARQLCARAGVPTPPTCTAEEAQAALEGAPSAENPVDGLRHRLMGFILAYWTSLRSQLTCPASTGNARACFECPDTRVLACVSTQAPPVQKEIVEHEHEHTDD